jgi:5-methylcytosine-specific restriction endonuclease McrA
VQNVRCHACRSAARRARGAEYRRTAGYLSKAMVRNWVRRGAVLAGDVSASDIAQLRYFAVDCPDCGCGMSDDSHRRTSKTIDHVIPIARGGEHSLENIRVVCWSCNSRKRDRVLA